MGLPEEVRQETGVDLTTQAKKKILGLNLAGLYGIEVPPELRLAETAAV